MRWKQFFTPAENMTAEAARTFITQHREGTFTLLDVRQPGEYENAHIPGAKLVPLPELMERTDELDPSKPVIAYCAIGGRSRAAAQLLKGKGFAEVYNLSGGIKAWDGLTASGTEALGMALLSGNETPIEAIKLAYGMETGLGEFYTRMAESSEDSNAADLLKKLAGIEEKHKLRLLELFRSVEQSNIQQAEFEKDIETSVMEGGLTTDEFIDTYRPVMQTTADVISVAMMLEAQALDLYLRYSDRSTDDASKKIFLTLADEEKAHLKGLGSLMNETV